MDPRFRGFSASMNGIQMENQSIYAFQDQNLMNGPRFQAGNTDQRLDNGPRLRNPYVENGYNGALFLPSGHLSNYIASTSSLPGDHLSSIAVSTSRLPTDPLSNYMASISSLPGDPLSSIAVSTSRLPSDPLSNYMASTFSLPGDILSSIAVSTSRLPSDPLSNYMASTSSLPGDPLSSAAVWTSRLPSGPSLSNIASTSCLPGDPLSSIAVSTSRLPSDPLSSAAVWTSSRLPSGLSLCNIASTPCLELEDDYSDDFDFSDVVLRYISQMLMEEDMEDRTCMLHESLELQVKEKSFYEALGTKYPPSPEQTGDHVNRNSENHLNCLSGFNYGDNNLCDTSWDQNAVNCNYNCVSQVCNVSHSSGSSSNSANTVFDGFLDSPISPLRTSDTYNEIQSILNFQKGVEEASKFLPTGDKLFLSLDVNGLTQAEKAKAVEEAVMKETSDEREHLPTESRGRKNPHGGDVDLEEERSRKQAAVYTESTIRSKEFDIVLLNSLGKGQEELIAYRTRLREATSNKMQQNGRSSGSTRAKGRGKKKQNGKKEAIDLRTLLINCAQAVAADDRRNANELLRQIRQHSSPFGDGNQRLAHCFADGLEARLAGTGSQIYKALVNKRTSAADYLKAYHLYLASCPFKKVSNFASNKTAMMKAKGATRIHIIDFGILYGFQWPPLFQRIGGREGGPPKLRITGIEFPQPGFRPAEQIEETGRRLADYARTFDVPFEYNAIAKNWETVRLEDLKLDKDEFLVVNCMYRLKNLRDETVAVESSRTIVLNLIRRINPDIFVHGIVNGAYGAPFFVTRFREVLFHFSSLFDMLDTNVPRDIPERMLIERDIFGKEAMNVIACEGWERVERPETYKQWQVRHLRAGFAQVPFERFIVNTATQKVTSNYHKDFVTYEDGHWLLLGWKGRVIFALSCWKPV